MPIRLSVISWPIAACCLTLTVTLALGGCMAAAPLAQMAVSAAQGHPSCTTGSGCNTSMAGLSFSDLSKQIDQQMRSLTGTKTDDPATGVTPPPK